MVVKQSVDEYRAERTEEASRVKGASIGFGCEPSKRLLVGAGLLFFTFLSTGAALASSSKPKSDSLHVSVGHSTSDSATVVIKDGKDSLLRQTVAPVFDGGASPMPSVPLSVERSGSEIVATQQFSYGSSVLTLTMAYRKTASGEIVVCTRLRGTGPMRLFLRSMFTAVGDVQPFWIHHQGEGTESADYVSPGPDAEYAPLPLLGVRRGTRRYVLASGATWESPLPEAAEPELRVEGRALSAPQIGSAEYPVVLQADVEQQWITVLAAVPPARASDGVNAEVYALELGGQVAIYNVFSGAPPIVMPAGRPIPLRLLARKSFRAICFASAYWRRVTTTAGRHSLTPAAHYSPGSWSRDSFWTALGLSGAAVERQTEGEMLHAYAEAVPRSGDFAGRVPLLLSSPGVLRAGAGAISFDDESGLYFLIRMYRDAQVLHIPEAADLPLATLVVQYILKRQTKDGQFLSAGPAPFLDKPFSPNGWLDGYGYAQGDVITSNQGVFVVALEAALRLGVPLPDGLREQALKEYRDTYDPKRGYLRWLASKTYRSPDVLIGDALSLYLFDQPLLTDAAVQATLKAQVWTKHGMKVLATEEGGYVSSSEFLNTTNQGHSEEPAGWYQNGGSWLLWEYLAEYDARRHGDSHGCGAMKRSIDAEIEVSPTSKEFKLTFLSSELTQILDPNGNRTLGSTDSNRQGYGWNAAILAFEDNLKRRGLACAF